MYYYTTKVLIERLGLFDFEFLPCCMTLAHTIGVLPVCACALSRVAIITDRERVHNGRPLPFMFSRLDTTVLHGEYYGQVFHIHLQINYLQHCVHQLMK